MFPKNSAFTPDDDQKGHLERVKKDALYSSSAEGSFKLNDETTEHLLEVADAMIEDGFYDEAREVIARIREEITDDRAS